MVADVLLGVLASATAAVVLGVYFLLVFAIVWRTAWWGEGWTSWSRSRFDDSPRGEQHWSRRQGTFFNRPNRRR